MIIRRRWLDATGNPHVEEATWAAPPAGVGGVVLSLVAPMETEGPPPDTAVLVGLSDTAADPDLLSADWDAVYDVPLRTGAQIVGAAEWDQATATKRDEHAAVVSAVISESGEGSVARTSALTKLADVAGLSDAERTALFGEA